MLRLRRVTIQIFSMVFALMAYRACAAAESQIVIPRIEEMPNLPQPYLMRNWKKVARDYDTLVFDHNAKGRFLPIIWIDKSHIGWDEDGFGLPAALGHPDMNKDHPGTHESLNCIAAVVGASLVGIDKRSQDGFDYARMCKQYFSSAERGGPGIFLDVPSPPAAANSQGSLWYFLMCNVLASWLEDRYPGHAGLDILVRQAADNLAKMTPALASGEWFTGFDFKTCRPINDGVHVEGEAVAGLAYIEYMAYARFGDGRYLESARKCMDAIQKTRHNPYYEVLLPFGATLAARMNAEQDTNYDVERMLNWCMDADSACRALPLAETKQLLASDAIEKTGAEKTRRWGLITGRWGNYDVGGIIGCPTDGGGYGFAMNTFDTVAALAPLPRYDARFARAVGKYILNAANSCRCFYANGLPPENQTCYDQLSSTRDAIAYEGLRKVGVRPQDEKRNPCACGDPLSGRWGKPMPSDFSLYGSSHVGLLAAAVGPTSDPAILQIDCLATDFRHCKADPTYLILNPYAEGKEVRIDVGPKRVDLYDAVSQTVVASNVCGATALKLAKDSAVVIVLTPVGGKVTRQGTKRLVDGIVVDYRAEVKNDPAADRPSKVLGVDQYDLALRVNQRDLPRSNGVLRDQPPAKAKIRVHTDRVVAELNPRFIGYNIEDLSYALHPGLCADALRRELRRRTRRRVAIRLGGLVGAQDGRGLSRPGHLAEVAGRMGLRGWRGDARRCSPAADLHFRRANEQRYSRVRFAPAFHRTERLGTWAPGLLEAGGILLPAYLTGTACHRA